MHRQALLDAIDADREAHIALLQAFTQAPSPNPPGDTTAAAKFLSDYLSSRGISTHSIGPQSTMPNIVASFNGVREGPRVIMNGHIDTFPVDPSTIPEWKHDPFSGHYDGKYLYGRGVVDMKAGTVASTIAYAYLYPLRAHLKGSVGLTLVSDEETGGKYGSRWLLEREEWRGDVMVNTEPGGMQSIRFAEKGTLRITFEVETVGAHGAFLHLSEGANRVAARFVQSLLSVEDLEADVPEEIKRYLAREDVKRTIDEVMGKGASSLSLKPTVNVGIIKGGVKVNMIPDLCVMEVDIRLPIGMTKEVVLAHINTLLLNFPQVKMKVQEAASNPSSFCAPDHPMLEALATNAELVTGKKPLGISSLGATDCKFWRYAGVPAYVFGLSPDTMAAINERVDVEEFLAVAKTHALAVYEYLSEDREQ
jgi:succinyl-diaminopimelate desuccinylase